MWALRALCLAGLGAALGGGSADQCSWRGSGLSQEAGSVEQLSLHCAEGSLEWLYPTGALRLRLAPRLPPATATTKGRSPQHVTACVKPSGTFRGAQLYLEREGVLELLLPEAPRPRVRCFSWLPWEKVALFLQATPHRDISRRIAAFRYELRGDWLAHPALPAASLTGEGACRPCNDTEILMAICTSDFVIRGSIRSVSNDVELQESIIGVPYVPSSPQQVANTLALLRGRSGKTVDLGSGDGRIVVEAYKQGLRPAVGFELNPWLWHLSNYRAWKAGYHGKVSFLKKDLWKVNLSDCYNVIVFLAPSVKPPLAAKLLAELPDEARVVAGRFPFPSWTPTTTHGQGLDQVWAYDMKEVRRAAQSHAEGSPV